MQTHLIININIESWNLFRIKRGGTFAQYANILICTDWGSFSEAFGRKKHYIFMQISLLFLTKVFPANSYSIFISKVAPLEEFPQWENKGDEDLPWNNLWSVGTQLPFSVFRCHGSLASGKGDVLMEIETRCTKSQW